MVIPGRREAASPESILTGGGYGFRARATQVGYRRVGQHKAPISGKPEIGGAPRNDGGEIEAAPPSLA